MNTKTVILSFLVVVPIFGEASVYANEPGGAVESIQQKAYEISGKDALTIKFSKGESQLSSNDESALRTMYNAVRDNAAVKEVVVVAYSDLPYPDQQKSDLPKASRSLAEKRGEVVKTFMKGQGAKNVRVVNMAKHASWFGKMVDSKDAELKQEATTNIAKASGDDLFYESLGRHLRAEAEPGEVVVVVRHD